MSLNQIDVPVTTTPQVLPTSLFTENGHLLAVTATLTQSSLVNNPAWVSCYLSTMPPGLSSIIASLFMGPLNLYQPLTWNGSIALHASYGVCMYCCIMEGTGNIRLSVLT